MSEEPFTHLSTQTKGTFCYIDPYTAGVGRLTVKTDVFAFGVVLLELVSGRLALDRSFFGAVSMIDWATPKIKRGLVDGNFEGIVDARLSLDYDFQELREMFICSVLCVRRNPDNRPNMSQILEVLEGHISAIEISGGEIWDEDEMIDIQALRSLAFGQSSQQMTGASEIQSEDQDNA